MVDSVPAAKRPSKLFKQSKGLTPDGIVGPGTMAALQINAAVAGTDVSGATTGAAVPGPTT